MILRTCALLCLLSLAAAQTGEPSAEVPTDAMTMTEDMMDDMTDAPMTDAPMTDAPMTDAPPTTSFMPNLTAQYANLNASEQRRRHFYCLRFNQSSADFPRNRVRTSNLAETTCSTGRECVLWTLFIQYPVLSYLDSQRKLNLLTIVADLARSGAGTALNGFDVTQFCIAQVTHNRVSTYSESVLVSFYFQGGPVRNPFVDTASVVEVMQFDTYFKRGFEAAANDRSDMRVVRYENRWAINVSYSAPAHGDTNENSHPLARGFENQRSRDPTINAIILNSFPPMNGGVNISDAEASLSSPGTLLPQQFASNPNPINFHLEAGDIVFAVFGTIFLTLLMGVVILGFCIHPFFLA